jgi:CRP/FNR family transcriptional regulator, anaerobic regulatory protein
MPVMLIKIKAKTRPAPDDYADRTPPREGETLVMTSSTKTRSESRAGASALCSAAKAAALDAIPAAIGSQAAILRTRRGQTLALSFDGGETAFIVRAGVLTLQLTLPDSSRQIVALLFPGDVFRSNCIPPHAEATLASAGAGEVWRMRLAALDQLATADPAVTRYLDGAAASQSARQALHVATLGQFNCEQRVATLLVELALRTGVSSASGVAFELPFNRKDIADYLGLNPDTLSRIMSRLKAAGLIGHSERNRVAVRNFSALAARSPAARSLLAIGGAGRIEPSRALHSDA